MGVAPGGLTVKLKAQENAVTPVPDTVYVLGIVTAVAGLVGILTRKDALTRALEFSVALTPVHVTVRFAELKVQPESPSTYVKLLSSTSDTVKSDMAVALGLFIRSAKTNIEPGVAGCVVSNFG